MITVSTDDPRRALRAAIATADGAALVAQLRQGWPQDALQLPGDGLAAAVQQHVPGAAELAHECVQALRDREWDGDEELAGHLEAVLGVAPTPLLRRLQVDLEMLSGVLEGDPLSGDGRVDLRSGEVWPPEVIDYAVESGELDEADADDPERWLCIHNR